MARLIELSLAGMYSAVPLLIHANRMFESCSTIVQYTAPIIASPIKATRSDITEVERTKAT